MAGTNSIIATGSARAIITANQAAGAGAIVKSQPGKVGQVVVWNVGTSATIDVYDSSDGSATNHVWSWATADGKGIFAIQTPMLNGIAVVVAGTGAPSLTVVYT